MNIDKYIQSLFLITLLGCDVPGIVEVKNNYKDAITFSYSFKDDYSNKRSITVMPKESQNIMYGFGFRWTDSRILNHATDVVDTIYLNAGEKHYYCSTEECKKAIFNKLNRKSKKKLEIVVDSTLIENSFIEI